MRYVQINATATAWAKSIILGKHRQLLAEGHEPYFFWGRRGGEEDERCRRFATDLDNYADGLLTRMDGKPGFHSRRATRRLLGWLDEIDPDVVHLHNLLGYYINIEMLFDWLAGHRCKVVWTIHDCWAFTGHCIHFTYADCGQWRDGCATCARCPQKRTYPQTLAGDSSVRWSYEQKRRLFTMLAPGRMRLIVPSQWLANLVGQSYLSKYDVTVVHNTVDTSVFKPTPSDFRERYGIGDRFMVLGVASSWSARKGLGDFVRLAGELDSERFAVVLVGLSKKQAREVGKKALALPKTGSAVELAEIYTAADVFFNPTREDNYPTVNLEAEACGTPVVTYDTGGCAETLRRADSVVVGGYAGGLSVLRECMGALA